MKFCKIQIINYQRIYELVYVSSLSPFCSPIKFQNEIHDINLDTGCSLGTPIPN